jgi:hypothetical protein
MVIEIAAILRGHLVRSNAAGPAPPAISPRPAGNEIGPTPSGIGPIGSAEVLGSAEV